MFQQQILAWQRDTPTQEEVEDAHRYAGLAQNPVWFIELRLRAFPQGDDDPPALVVRATAARQFNPARLETPRRVILRNIGPPASARQSAGHLNAW